MPSAKLPTQRASGGLKAGRYAHAKQFKRMRKSIKTLKTYLGRVIRELERKTDIVTPEFKDALTQAKRLLTQKSGDSHKLYSLHEPHVACISKGKAHKKYEFGNKVSVCVTNKEGFIVGTQGLEGNPYDGHTLKGALDQVTELTEPSQSAAMLIGATVDMALRIPMFLFPVSVATSHQQSKKNSSGAVL